jgi:CRISPR/Cas system CSM-associated protein Csm3 (group 7 of RAMP superfamily)
MTNCPKVMNQYLHFQETEVTLELETPMHIGSGNREGGSDAGVVRDHNGLPAIPGTSLQGMLRSAFSEPEKLFGRSGTNKERDNGRGGRVWLSWATAHNANGQPARGWLTPNQRDQDPVLRDAAAPFLRDHVKLNERGVADDRGKFDELVVSKGHRFTFTLRLATYSTKAEPQHTGEMKELLTELSSGELRLGGKTRRGLGAFKVVTPEPIESTSKQFTTYKLELTPEDLWMFGGGLSADSDSAPVIAPFIEWSEGGQGSQGSVQSTWLIPGSAVKGALRHRTIFHANRLHGHFADLPDSPAKTEAKKKTTDLITKLFGDVTEETAIAGRVYIDDVLLKPGQSQKAPIQNHVSINPFLGGAKDTALFDDQPLFRSNDEPIEIEIHLRGDMPKAFEAAIEDLCNGYLPLGAHAGRGYGIFTGTKTITKAS